MPIYQYKCQSCQAVVEVMQRMSDPPLVECESCRGPLKKIIAPAGLIFKGSGFHSTDYRGSESGVGSTPALDAKRDGETGAAASDGKGTEGKGDVGGKGPASGKGDAGGKGPASAGSGESSQKQG